MSFRLYQVDFMSKNLQQFEIEVPDIGAVRVVLDSGDIFEIDSGHRQHEPDCLIVRVVEGKQGIATQMFVKPLASNCVTIHAGIRKP